MGEIPKFPPQGQEESEAWQPPEEDYEETLRMKAMGRRYRRPETPDDDPYPLSDSGFALLQQRREERLFGTE